ncbi:MAG: D-2-hydroxyacid dehydrogenase [Spirochaetia bacterium]|nr:D-2-hydroxyacid dehydrogenase [Spirochaetia bacterium]
MHIVVLDGYTLNPGDLSWEPLERLGELTVYERTGPDEILSRAAGAEVLITNKTVIDAACIAALPRLRYIGVLATGYNVVDLQAAADRSIPVTNIPAYSTDSVAQMVFSHILHLTMHTAEHAESVAGGKWSSQEDFCFWDHPMVELSGLTFGIIGYGMIGQRTADLARAFGMQVIAYDRSAAKKASMSGVTFTDIDTVFRRSDVVSLHCPLTRETSGIVSARRLGLMKSSALLINTSRGLLVDEQALAAALDEGQIAGAGLDVLSQEPPAADHPLLHVKNCYITPHIAWATSAARRRLLAAAVENVRSWMDGEPQHVVNLSEQP